MFTLQRTMWIFLLLACVGASWFAYQCFLVPHPARFNPDWQGAQWIQAADGNAPVAYFRHVTSVDIVPDAAFVTVAASQVFRLYVNGTFIASNALDFLHDSSPRAYIYDVNTFLQSGTNVIAVRVANVDKQIPCVRVSMGLVRGKFASYAISSTGWLATGLSTLVYPRYSAKPNAWTTVNFTSAIWHLANIARNPAVSPLVTVNPLLYEQPVALRWISAGATHDAYFVRQFSLSESITDTWLRLVATGGTASVFINGHLLIIWNGEAPVPRQNLASYLSNAGTTLSYRTGLALGVYDISPYIHPGTNTLAVHVSAPGVSAAQVGLDNLRTALSLDMLTSDMQGRNTWLMSDMTWRASPRSVVNWINGSDATLRWSLPLQVARPGVSRTFYLPESITSRNTQVFPLSLVCEVILLSCGGVISFWLLMSLILTHRYYGSYKTALETLSIAYVPALACEAVLLVLSRESLFPLPFPYTRFWGGILIMIVVSSYVLLWLNARKRLVTTYRSLGELSFPFSRLAQLRARLNTFRQLHTRKVYPYIPARVAIWFYHHWIVIPLILSALPLAFYNLSYEPYWQDELSSYYAAHGILAHGLPFFPSGFLYEKAELYSYFLALWTALFGDSAVRFISAIEYIVSIPLLYFVGCYFFSRRIALLATATLTLSPAVLLWERQVRMYEQAQLLTLLVMYLFYRAVQEQRRIRFVYMAMLCLIIDYFSHEETFIILPALVVCVLLLSKRAHRRFLSVLYQKQWWYALSAGTICIAVQVLLTHLTHPPVLGTDSSERPFIQFSLDNVPFYLNLLFFPSALSNGTLPWITLNSILATIGCIWARHDDNPCAKYCALFLSISFFTLMLVFTMQADRYFYLLLPVYYLIGSYALMKMLDIACTFARSRLTLQRSLLGARMGGGEYLSWQMCWTLRCTMLLICACVLVAPMLPMSNYNLFISRLAGLSYHRHYPDYDAVGQYMQQHWRKGDVVISVAPDFSVFYYTGHVDYFFSIDRALYLFERNGHIVDTSIGAKALLSQGDFRAVLAAHARIWVISDNAEYQAQVAKRFAFPPDFRIVFEGYGSAVYFRGD